MHETVQQLLNLKREMPRSLTREFAGANPLVTAVLGFIDNRANPVREAQELLLSTEMTDLIESGHVTIAMIKPRLDKHMNTAEVSFIDDPSLTAFLEDKISTLQPVFSVSLKMTKKMVEEFYGRRQSNGKPSPKESMMSNTVSSGRTVWQEFIELMDSGPVTFIVLYDEEGRAVEKWRNEMGTTFNVDKLRESEPGSLRARYAITNQNNIFHGSDSPDSAIIERDFVANHMR